MPTTPAPTLTPTEFRQLKEVSGTTYTQLQEATGVSRSQLSEFSTGVGRLRDDQLEKIERVLMRAVRHRSATINKLVAGEAA